MKDDALIHIQGVALNAVADGEDAPAPEWVQLTPAGPHLQGIDGRSWSMSDPQALVDKFKAENQTLPIDISHSTEFKAPKGEEAPAVGWITDLEVRAGAIWGRVDWNEAGANAIASRAYRYLSPVFWFDKARNVMRLRSAGLTNQPNFFMTALNRADATEDDDMSLAAIREKLGLGEDADEGAILTAINAMETSHETALNAAKEGAPDASQYVPMATYQTALNRAQDAEGKLAEVEAEGQEAAINAAVDAAIEEKKIAPADRDYFVASCKAEGGL